MMTIFRSDEGAAGRNSCIDNDWDGPTSAGCRKPTRQSLPSLAISVAHEDVTLALKRLL